MHVPALPITYLTYPGLPPEPLLEHLLDSLVAVFPDSLRAEWETDLTLKSVTYSDFHTLLAVDGDRVTGCKLGYGWPNGVFYSWLGGVHPDWRGQGIAGELMHHQHEGVRQLGYHTIRTHTYNQWREMLILNLRHGFRIIGTQPGKRGLTIQLEKALLAQP